MTMIYSTNFSIVPYGYRYPQGIFNGKKTYKYSNLKIGEYETIKGLINLPCAFDIETTTFEDTRQLRSCMYVWQFAIEQTVYMGRTWIDFQKFIAKLNKKFQLSKNKKLVVYVHNLSYEFGFMRKWFKINKVFAINSRRPLYVEFKNIIFKCSWLLSGLSLENLAKTYCGKENQKLKGDLAYTKIRHSSTLLYYHEICYCVNDTTIVTEYIQKMIDKWGDISKIPLTKTSEVRLFCRNACLYKNKKHQQNIQYKSLMEELILSPNEYRMLRRAYTGGFTHANSFSVNKLLKDIDSFDFCSSYPAVMCSEFFPMSRGTLIKKPSKEEIKYHLRKHCCLLNIRFKNIQDKFFFEHYLSESKCFYKNGVPLCKIKNTKEHEYKIINNGRVVYAEYLETTITEIDWQIINKCYTWDSIEFGRLIWYEKGYLPKQIIESVLEFYNKKTELKDIVGMEDIYLCNKEMVNSTYGMMVTNILHTIYGYDDEWLDPKTPDLNTEIEKYNNDKKRFLFYPWGVWIVKYATRNLWSGIFHMSKDYHYSDTDSLKISNSYLYNDYFTKYNTDIVKKIHKCLEYYNIPIEKASPKTKKGLCKPLGIWEHDGDYYRFKTLGAKRYLTESVVDGYLCFKATVAGIPKKALSEYLCNKYNWDTEKIFDAFNNELEVPKGLAGKKLISYIDHPMKSLEIDYRGVIGEINERCCVALTENSFTMNMSRDFMLFLNNLEFPKIDSISYL